jgi:hypothetical protein
MLLASVRESIVCRDDRAPIRVAGGSIAVSAVGSEDNVICRYRSRRCFGDAPPLASAAFSDCRIFERAVFAAPLGFWRIDLQG